MSELAILCTTITPFAEDLTIDEDALRAHLNRLVDAGVGVYLGSGGAGEAHVMSLEEFERVCEIGVEVCKGKVPTYATPREPRSASDMIVFAEAAFRAGVDRVQLYQLDGGHGMVPNAAEQDAYWSEVLDAMAGRPVALSIHGYGGYRPRAGVLRALCERYSNIEAINVMGWGSPAAYLSEVRDEVPESVELFTGISYLVQGLALGYNGAISADANVVPNLCRSVIDAWQAGDNARVTASMTAVQRFANIISEWMPTSARWVKMALRVLDLPGGQSPLRSPYVMPGQDDLDRMLASFEAMNLVELEEASTRVTS